MRDSGSGSTLGLGGGNSRDSEVRRTLGRDGPGTLSTFRLMAALGGMVVEILTLTSFVPWSAASSAAARPTELRLPVILAPSPFKIDSELLEFLSCR